MRQAKIHWAGQPPRANRARAAAATESWAPPAALYSGMAGLGLAAGAMLIAAGLARQPDIGAMQAAAVPAAETLPAPAARPAEPLAIAAATDTEDRVAQTSAVVAETPATPPAAAAPVAARFGGTAPASQSAPPPFAAPASDAGRPGSGLAAFAGGDAPVRAPLAVQTGTAPQTVEVAETEAEVLAIEARLAAEGDPNFRLPPETATETVEPAALASAPASGSGSDPTNAAVGAGNGLPAAWAREHVNLRAGPDNDARVLAIIPGNAAFAAADGCDHWCEAVYEGQSGFVYDSFIRRDAP